MISERPAKVANRAVPGHLECDLVVGAGHRSAIGTIVERTSHSVVLLHLPEARTAHAVNATMTDATGRRPTELARSVTWDQGTEMSKHLAFTIPTGTQIYFCNPPHLGSGPRTRTPTASCASFSPRVQTSVCRAMTIWPTPYESPTAASARGPCNDASRMDTGRAACAD